MIRKKRTYTWIAILVMFLALGSYAWWRWKTPKPPEGFVVPNHCNWLGSINTHELIEWSTSLINAKSSDSSKIPPYLKWIKNELHSTGLDLLAPWWLYGSTSKNYMGLALPISSQEVFDSFLIRHQLLPKNSNEPIELDSGKYLYKKGDFIYLFFGIKPSKELFNDTINTRISPDIPYLSKRFSGELIKLVFSSKILPSFAKDITKDSFVFAQLSVKTNLLEASFENIKWKPGSIDTTLPFSASFECYPSFWQKVNPQWFLSQQWDTSGWWGKTAHLEAKFNGVVKEYLKVTSFGFDEEFNPYTTTQLVPKFYPGFFVGFNSSNFIQSDWELKSKWDSIKTVEGKNIFHKHFWSFPVKIKKGVKGWEMYSYQPLNPSKNPGYVFFQVNKLKSFWKEYRGEWPQKWETGPLKSIGVYKGKKENSLMVSCEFENDKNPLLSFLKLIKYWTNAR